MSGHAGSGGRLGLVVPSSNTTAEVEFDRYTPEAVSIHTARMALESVTVDELDAMSDGAGRAAELLGHAEVDVVAYACTTGSLLHGPGFDAELEETLSAAANAPAVATARSVVRALETLDAHTIAVATPYTADLDERERDFLTAAGFEVVAIDGRGIEANVEIGALGPDDAHEQVIELSETVDRVDAVFISCTNYRSLDAVAALETELDLPVITSNGATLWDACRVASLPVEGPGTLFERDGE